MASLKIIFIVILNSLIAALLMTTLVALLLEDLPVEKVA